MTLSKLTLNKQANRALEKVRAAEPSYRLTKTDATNLVLAKQLLDLYHNTKLLYTQYLIEIIFKQAGKEWLNRLHAQDQISIEQSNLVLASLQDYLQILAANDDYQKSIQHLVC